MDKNSIKHIFICDFCRKTCKGGCHEKLMRIKEGIVKLGNVEYEENKDLIGRKQIIHCLGKYCDTPCELQREEYTPFNETDGIQPLIDSLKWMVGKLNNVIEKSAEEK